MIVALLFSAAVVAQTTDSIIYDVTVKDGQIVEKPAQYIQSLPGAFLFRLNTDDELFAHLNRDETIGICYVNNNRVTLEKTTTLKVLLLCFSSEYINMKAEDDAVMLDSYVVEYQGHKYCIKNVDVVDNSLLSAANRVAGNDKIQGDALIPNSFKK